MRVVKITAGLILILLLLIICKPDNILYLRIFSYVFPRIVADIILDSHHIV